MQIILQQVGMMFIFILAGYLLGYKKLLDNTQTKILSVVLLYVVLPCNVFNTFSQQFTLAYLREKYVFILVGIALVIVTLAISKPMAKKLAETPYESVLYRYALCMPNYGYMGYPVVSGIFGSAALMNFMLYVMPINIMTYIYFLPRMTKKESFSLKTLVNPPIIGMVLGMIVGLTEIPVPSFISTVCSSAQGCLGPLGMLMTGITISMFPLKKLVDNKKTYLVTAYRMILLPAAIWLLLKPFCPEDLVRVAVLAYAMPCGMNTIVFPKLVGENNIVGASLPFVSTVICMLTLPVFLYFV